MFVKTETFLNPTVDIQDVNHPSYRQWSNNCFKLKKIEDYGSEIHMVDNSGNKIECTLSICLISRENLGSNTGPKFKLKPLIG